MKKAPVDLMIEQWTQERPDLDSSSLGVLARISRLARATEENAARLLDRYGLSEAEFQLLAAIRTSPELPSPRDLLELLMVTSGGLTNRIDRLERAGLVERAANPLDRRGVHLKLTRKGLEVVDEVTTEYLANQNAVLDAALDSGEREALANLLQRLLASLTESSNGSPDAGQRARHAEPAVLS